eukprot:250131-Rhodomonas_salina.1
MPAVAVLREDSPREHSAQALRRRRLQLRGHAPLDERTGAALAAHGDAVLGGRGRVVCCVGRAAAVGRGGARARRLSCARGPEGSDAGAARWDAGAVSRAAAAAPRALAARRPRSAGRLAASAAEAVRSGRAARPRRRGGGLQGLADEREWAAHVRLRAQMRAA